MTDPSESTREDADPYATLGFDPNVLADTIDQLGIDDLDPRLNNVGERGYEMLDVVGRGGMGVVYSARQRELDRVVAIKRLHDESDQDQSKRMSFLAEARVTGFLDHPNIVPVYGLEEDANRVSMSMKLVRGETWASLLESTDSMEPDQGLSGRLVEQLQVLITICNAVAYAHSNNFIHRDLKPSNVMIGEFGEVLLMDWGLAIALDRETAARLRVPHRSSVHKIAGTPAYMAPEMAEGRGEDLCIQSDIFLLGAILYELLSGDAPFVRDTLIASINASCQAEPVPLGDDVPRKLVDICQKAMAREPINRFHSVVAFQSELRDYLTHRESEVLSGEADARLARYSQKAEGVPGSRDQTKLYADLAQVVSAFHQANVLWSQNPRAKQGEAEARRLFAKFAIEGGDFGLARTQVADLDDDESRALLAQIVEAEKQRAISERAAANFRRLVVVGLVLLGTLGAGTIFLLRGMRAVGDQIAVDVESQLIDLGRERLEQIVGDSASVMEGKRKAIELALRAYADGLQRALISPVAPAPGAPILYSSEVDSGSATGFSLIEHDDYARLVDGNLAPNPVSFEASSYFLPAAVTRAESLDQILRAETVTPLARQLFQQYPGLIIRYFAGFQSQHLYTQFPGAGNVLDSYDPTRRQWYEEASKVDGIFHTQPYSDTSTQQIVLSAVLTVRDDEGNILGVAGVDSNLIDRLATTTLPVSWANAAEVEVVELVGTPPRFRVLSKREYADQTQRDMWQFDVELEERTFKSRATYDTVRTAMANGASGVVDVQREGRRALLAFAPLSNSGLALTITVDRDAIVARASEVRVGIQQQSRRELTNLTVIVVSALAVVMLAAIWLGRRTRVLSGGGSPI